MTISIQRLGAQAIHTHLDGLVALLRDAVDNGSSVNFLAPLDRGVAAAFWERIAGEVGASQRIVLAAFDGGQIVGCVHLVLDTERGSAGEKLYERVGYMRAGGIPQFAMNHDGTKLIDTVLFYKLL